MTIKIYLAGPDVFRTDAKRKGESLKELCKLFGFEALFPLDNEIEPLDSKKIFEANLGLIKQADIILANIEPFRGPSADVGTAWEMGAGKALGKIVIAYHESALKYNERANSSTDYPIVEDFGLSDNLMLIHGSHRTFESMINALEYLQEEFGKAEVIFEALGPKMEAIVKETVIRENLGIEPLTNEEIEKHIDRPNYPAFDVKKHIIIEKSEGEE